MSEISDTVQQQLSCSSSEGEQETERPERMREWLIRMINSGRFPGLEWLNEQKTMFKVPWIHAKKRGYNKERDAALFKAWAIHSGKYRDESDPTVWKINFRCAINGLKDIMELKDLQTEDCRIYQVLPSTRKPKRRRMRIRSSTDPYTIPTAPSTLYGSPGIPTYSFSHSYPAGTSCYPASTYHYPANLGVPGPYTTTAACLPTSAAAAAAQHYTSECGGYYNQSVASPYSEPRCTTSCYNPTSVSGVDMSSVLPIRREDSPDSGIVEPSHSVAGSPAQVAQGSPVEACQYSSPIPSIPAISSCSMTEAGCSPPNNYPLSVITSSSSTAEDSQIIDVIAELHSESPHPSPINSPLPHQLNVSVYYGTTAVINQDVAAKGCRIFYGSSGYPPSSSENGRIQSLFGPMDAEQISLPSNHPLPHGKDLLDTMKRGLVIEMHGNDVYATAMCCCIVYCGTSYYQQSIALEKDVKTKVFDYNNFQPVLERYALHCGPPPEPHIIFSLGQPWSPHNPVTQNMISLVVTHAQAKQDIQTFLPPFFPSHTMLTSSVPDSVDVQRASLSDIKAESFLSSVLHC